jgi:hypothetical protein
MRGMKRRPQSGNLLSFFILPDKVSLFISQESLGYKGKRGRSWNFEFADAGSLASSQAERVYTWYGWPVLMVMAR